MKELLSSLSAIVAEIGVGADLLRDDMYEPPKRETPQWVHDELKAEAEQKRLRRAAKRKKG